MKAILVITNVVVMVAGAVLLVAGGIFFSKKFDFFPDLEDYSTNVNAVLIPMMIIGGVLFVVGLIGCCGAVTGKAAVLNIYFVIVLIVVILEIVIIILGVVKKDDFVKSTETYTNELFAKYKEVYVDNNGSMDDDETLAVNAGMNIFECCGLTGGPAYWGTSDGKVPPGCCSGWEGKNIVDALVACDGEDEEIYQTGCITKVKDLADEFGTVIIIVTVVVIVFEIICLAAACYSKKNDMVA